MILNHKAAIELLAEHADEIGFNRYTLRNLHALLSENLPPEAPSLIEEWFDQILATAAAIADPFEQAFFAMVQLPYLQPFENVNKRVSRLAANIPLVQRNLGPLSFVDVPQFDYTHAILGVYELNRVDYLRDIFEWAYERLCARHAAVRPVLGEPDAFGCVTANGSRQSSPPRTSPGGRRKNCPGRASGSASPRWPRPSSRACTRATSRAIACGRSSTSTTSIRRHRSTWVPRTAGQDAKDMARNAAGKNPKIPGGDSDCRTAGADATNLAGYKRLTLPEGPRRFSPP